MLDPRWRKVLRDLSSNKTRTILVVASIAVGIFAVGVVQQLRTVILNTMQDVSVRSNTAYATIITENIDDAMLESILRVPGVAEVRGENNLTVQVQIEPGNWVPMGVEVVEDFESMRINTIELLDRFPNRPDFEAEKSRWPGKNEIVIERGSLSSDVLPADIKVGSTILVENEAGKRRELTVSGVVYDANSFPSAFTNRANTYVDLDTFERLGGSRNYGQVALRVSGTPEQLTSKDYVVEIADEVGDKIERSGRNVFFKRIPEPGELFFQDIFETISLMLTPLGLLALALSGFLVINTISALMAQQVRQIGVMKAVGAQRGQVFIMYIGAVLLYSILALLIAIPITVFVAGGLMQILGGFINIDFPRWVLPLPVLLVQVGVGILIPLLAALYPVIRGTGVTVREAISDFGIGNVGVDLLNLFLTKIRGLSRPIQLSLRNTFRKRARLILTLLTMIMGGMIFMTVGSVRISLGNLIEEALAYNQFDIQIVFERTYRTALTESTVSSMDGVTSVESWGQGSATRVRTDGTESDSLSVFALPPGSQMVQPTLEEGRWLIDGDESAVVISTKAVAAGEDDIQVGDEIVLEIDEKDTAWTVVGIAQVLGGPPSQIPVYVPYDYYSRLTDNVGQSLSIQVKVDRSQITDINEMMNMMEEQLNDAGLRVAETFTIDIIRRISSGFFDIIIVLLSAMGVLIASVGALGLMGTMSTNVLERTREIGVMRAVGASNRSVRRIVIIEGVIIGMISWVIGAILAFPAGLGLSNAVGQALFSTSLPYTFSSTGVIVWLFIVAILATVASVLPAWNASRLTVREVLSYE
ncbi:MAG: ABC transporter permease [Chloroflexota bacterium]